MALKLDVSKAYDRVEWLFLQGVMQRLGFPETWIERVISCVTTTSFSILVNGKPFSNVLPSRGIRQGDPLSPYLFLLCTEGFTSLLDRVDIGGTLHGVAICRNAPKITNLLFVDDSLIFSRASPIEIHIIVEILQVYAKASGQCINLEKSLVYFSNNTIDCQKQEALGILGVKEVSRFDSYLGLPTLIGSKIPYFFFH